jgi:alanine racemase
VLYAHRGRDSPLAQHHRAPAAAIGQDQSMDVIETSSAKAHPELPLPHLTNSAALGLRTGIDSLRRGLMMMGYTQLEKWLVGQLPHAGTDLNLQPVRLGMVLRAR